MSEDLLFPCQCNVTHWWACVTGLSKSAKLHNEDTGFQTLSDCGFCSASIIAPAPITLGNPFIMSNIFRRGVQRKAGKNTLHMWKKILITDYRTVSPKSSETLHLENLSLIRYWYMLETTFNWQSERLDGLIHLYTFEFLRSRDSVGIIPFFSALMHPDLPWWSARTGQVWLQVLLGEDEGK